MKKFFRLFSNLFVENRISMSSAALSYYLTMTFFPVIICLYTLLGRSLEKADEIFTIIESLMANETVEFIRSFLLYISDNYSILMMLFAISVVLISASAGIRSIENTIGRMQGGMRFYGYNYFILSVILSIVYVFIIYACIILMFISKNIIDFINSITPFEISGSWVYLKYILIFILAFVFIWLIYFMCKRKEDHYNTIIGCITATVLLTFISFWFSKILSFAVKYPLIYGSLASAILLMFWLYCICLSIYVGATVNITLRDLKDNERNSVQVN